MRYSIDLRKRVLDFVEAGGSKAEASRRFSVSRTIIYEWLDASNPFTYEKPGPVDRAPLTLRRYENMLVIFQTRHLANARATIMYPHFVFGID